MALGSSATATIDLTAEGMGFLNHIQENALDIWHSRGLKPSPAGQLANLRLLYT